jgi:hypothetical protein
VLAAALAAALPMLLAADGPRCASFDQALTGIGSRLDDLSRTAGLAGLAPLRSEVLRRPSGARPLWLCDGGAPGAAEIADPAPLPEVRLDLVPPALLSTVHTGWSDDRNDGALFGGRGLGSSLTAGARLRWRWFTLKLAPLMAWQENASFHLPASAPPRSPWANPFDGPIDLPLRMGPRSFWTTDWGQTVLRAEVGGFAAGLSTENLWWGPGLRNALLMSDSAAGIPHVFVGTARPQDIGIGTLEAELLWGRLRSSPYADPGLLPRRLFEGLVLAWSPSFAAGLTVGGARVFVFPTDDVSFHHYFDPILSSPYRMDAMTPSNPSGDSLANELVSLFFRWAMPEAGFELYGEWGRDDAAWAFSDLVQDPGHSQAFLLGFQKLLPWRRGRLRVQAEVTQIFEMSPAQGRGAAVFYTNGHEPQGYTQGGQMIGAGLGPQSDSQFLALDWLHGPGQLGIFVERVARHERYFYDNLASLPAARHDVALSAGTRGAWSLTAWDLSWEAAWTRRYALDFGPQRDGLDARLAVTYWPGRAEPPALPERR